MFILRNHVLQADTEEACKIWVNALQAAIDAAYNESSTYDHKNLVASNSSDSLSSSINCSLHIGSQESQGKTNSNCSSGLDNNGNADGKMQRVSSQIMSLAGNEFCCDCRSPEPKWASINLGITLCIECSGIHRSLGVHISKVRSLILDDWEGDTIKIMVSLGNSLINSIYEEKVNQETELKPITHDSDRSERELWIKAKYVMKKFVCKDVKKVQDGDNRICDQGADDGEHEHDNYFNQLLFLSASNGDIIGMREAIAKDADINWLNPLHNGKCSLHETVLSRSVIATEFLLINGAKCNLQDFSMRTPLHLAVEQCDTGQVCLLLKRGADQRLLDNEQQDALAIAVNNRNADIVTL